MFATLTKTLRVFENEIGSYTEIPAVLTSSGWLLPLVDYLLANRSSRSLAWMERLCRSVELFIAYVEANQKQEDTYLMFQGFAAALQTGTFNLETRLDPSGLCWSPKSTREARTTIIQMTEFFDWLQERRGVAAVNPRYEGTAWDRRLDQAAYRFRRDQAFLGHTWAVSNPKDGHMLRAPRAPKVERDNPPAFPENRFEDLLVEGFRVGRQPNYRDMLITLLINGAGFRYSESFHLYVEDVIKDPWNEKMAYVQIGHPSDSDAPKDPNWVNERGRMKTGKRRAYLAEMFGLAPRHLLMDSRHAGWKGGLHEPGVVKRAYWFVPQMGEVFLTLWWRYLEQLARYSPRSHPFAFINLSQGDKGDMYKLGKYWQAHARACERIGLTVGKECGTTPHSHRHAYGRRLVRAKIPKEMRRKMLHHLAMESQNVYTTPSFLETAAQMAEAAERMNQKFRRDL